MEHGLTSTSNLCIGLTNGSNLFIGLTMGSNLRMDLFIPTLTAQVNVSTVHTKTSRTKYLPVMTENMI